MLSLTFLGAVLFFVLWEANRKYNVCFMGVCLLLMADGIGRCLQWMRQKQSVILRRKNSRIVMAAMTTVCIVLISYIQITIASQTASAQENVIYHCRNNPDSVAVSDVSRKAKKHFQRPVLLEQIIRQGQLTKEGDKEKIILNFDKREEKIFSKNKLKKLQPKKEYKIEVLSLETGQKLYSRKVRNDQFSRNGKLVIRLPEISKDTSKGYVIRLHHYGKNYTMIPKVSRFPELDPYPYGSLYINGKKTFYDLSMSILQKKSES